MALPTLPGMSYQDMYRTILFNRVQMLKDVFSVELLLAICWEESFFNNVKQDPGTAVGFGQTEPSEFWKLETSVARTRGYHVSSLPRRRKIKKGDHEVTLLLGTLSDEKSIEVMSALLCHLYLELNKNLQAALEAYGGVPFSRQIERLVREKKLTEEAAKKIDSVGSAKRLQVIQGWRNCENILRQKLPFTPGDGRPVIRSALMAAKHFPRESSVWNDALFPEADSYWTG